MRYPSPLQVSGEPRILDFIKTGSTPTPTATSFTDFKTPTATDFQFLPQPTLPEGAATPYIEAGCSGSTNYAALTLAGKVSGFACSMGAIGGLLHKLTMQEWTRRSPISLIESNLSVLSDVESQLDDLERTFTLEGNAPKDLLPDTGEAPSPGETPKPIQTYEELKFEYRRVRLRVKTALQRLKVAGWHSWSVASYADEHLVKARDLVYAMEALLQAAQTSTTTYNAWFNKRNEEREREAKRLQEQVELEHFKKISAMDADIDIILPPDLTEPEY